MSPAIAERVADVRRLVDAARAAHAARGGIAPAIARTSGLSPQGVELGFAALETSATDADLRALVAAAGEAASVHVVLSANVFVAPLRALALARAAAPRVTVRPSPRDPVLTAAIVEAARDPAIAIVDERDPRASDAAEIHVYGRDATIAAVRARARPGVVVRGHGPGMGVAVISEQAVPLVAAEALAADVVAFDQRGCLSPRVVFVRGDEGAAAVLAGALDGRLTAWSAQVPRGTLSRQERSEARRWRETMAFAGRLWTAEDHGVGLATSPLVVPPSGRHVLVVPFSSPTDLAAALQPIAPFVVIVGTDDPGYATLVPHARVAPLGQMQRPPLDGPVDRRPDVARDAT